MKRYFEHIDINEQISVSEDLGEHGERVLVVLVTPNPANPEQHCHIEISNTEARALYNFLHNTLR